MTHQCSSAATSAKRARALASSMAALPLLLFLLLLPLSAFADSEVIVPPPFMPSPKCEDDPALLKELLTIRSQLQDLEESSLEKDLVIHDKEKLIAALRTELENSKKEGSSQNDDVLKELGSKAAQLEKDLEQAEVELQESQSTVKTLEATHSRYLTKIKELEKLVSNQKKEILNAEHALRTAESTLLRVQAEADAHEKELLKVHGGWLPPWTSLRLAKLQSSAADQWTKYGTPLVDSTKKKVSQKVSAAQEWSKPYLDNAKTHAQENWSPVLKRGAESVSVTVLPHFNTAKSKVVEGYEASKDFVSPQVEKVQNFVGPHIQVVKETCRPYVEDTAEIIRPYFKQVHSVTRPYTEKISRSYRNFLTSATKYHSQLQVSIKGKLQKIDFLAPLASHELAWFLSAALLVLPIMLISVFLSSQLGPRKKPVKPTRGHHGGHGHKKPKRAKPIDK